MKKEQFWKIIETTNQQSQGDQEKYCELLKQKLEALSIDEIVEFNNYFRTYHLYAYRRNLWSAAMIIKHFCSAEAFHYFRNWLISKGRTIYKDALLCRDMLVDIIDEGMECEFGGLDCVAADVYRQKTGSIIPDWKNKKVGEHFPKEYPIAMDYELDNPVMQQLEYPRLWEKFRGTTGLTTAINNLYDELKKHKDRHQKNVFCIVAFGALNEADQLLNGSYDFYGGDSELGFALEQMLKDFDELRWGPQDDFNNLVVDK